MAHVSSIMGHQIARPLAGRVAIVTGSSRGIGEGIARALADDGCDLMLNGRTSAEDGARLAQNLSQDYCIEAKYYQADLLSPRAAHDLVAIALAQFGRADILINNAGVQRVAPIEQFSDENWDEVLSLNLTAAFRAARAVIPQMRRKGWGRIINIASVHGTVASVHKCAYVAAKHGLVGLTKVIALETANHGITCNAICPGWVQTDLVQRQIDALARAGGLSAEQAGVKLLQAKQPMHSFSTAQSVGMLAAFLCGEAARTMTGGAYTMDGGWTAQ
jgi:3-hydroxybutyrate dehydrogenase